MTRGDLYSNGAYRGSITNAWGSVGVSYREVAPPQSPSEWVRTNENREYISDNLSWSGGGPCYPGGEWECPNNIPPQCSQEFEDVVLGAVHFTVEFGGVVLDLWGGRGRIQRSWAIRLPAAWGHYMWRFYQYEQCRKGMLDA